MAKARSQFRCSECRHVTGKWLGRCPECGTWGTVEEMAALTSVTGAPQRTSVPSTPAVPISSIDAERTRHFPTGVSELDRVLGGGIVPGSVALLAGDPGVGKSTLLLEVAHRWAQAGRRALYVSGEESAGQIRMRAERTSVAMPTKSSLWKRTMRRAMLPNPGFSRPQSVSTLSEANWNSRW